MHADEGFADLDAAVAALRAAFTAVLAGPPALSRSEAETRFVRFHLFPAFAWPLVRAGLQQAERDDDPARAFETMVKFVALDHHHTAQGEETGLHRDGQDYCTYVPLAVHAAAIGDHDRVRRLFHGGRDLPRHGAPVYRHAAGLLVRAWHPDWRHGGRALAQAEKFVAGKTTSQVDRAFTEILLTCCVDDPARRHAALRTFAALYLRSMWGMYKPWTRPMFLYGLASLARDRCPSFDWDVELAPLLDARQERLWRDYDARLRDFDRAAAAFQGELGFLRA